MRWQRLFADLEARLAGQDDADLRSEVAERVRAERAATPLADRLLAHVGARLVLALPSGRVRGVVLDAAPQWLLLAQDGAQVLVPVRAVVHVEGLSRAVAPAPGAVLSRLGLGHALRALARDRSAVAVHATGSVLTGTIDRVGADHLDLALHPPGEPRRDRQVSSVAAVAFDHLHQVRSAG